VQSSYAISFVLTAFTRLVLVQQTEVLVSGMDFEAVAMPNVVFRKGFVDFLDFLLHSGQLVLFVFQLNVAGFDVGKQEVLDKIIFAECF
jgi:hypothetical protein